MLIFVAEYDAWNCHPSDSRLLPANSIVLNV